MQLSQKENSKPMASDGFSNKQKKSALKSLMFTTNKRCSRVKAHGCTYGRNQREMYSKEEAISLTVLSEVVLLTSIIVAKEGRDVAIGLGIQVDKNCELYFKVN
eukprot:13433495-Ditylum_brightwellii.AAC.1